MPEGRYFHVIVLAFFVSVAVFPQHESAFAQDSPAGHGMVVLSDWPDDPIRETSKFDILPFVDSLSLAYRYQVTEDRPELSIVMEWSAGTEVIYNGERMKMSELDGTPAIVGLDLTADVLSGGRFVAGFSLAVDSMIVEPSPDVIRIDLPELSWENVFVDTPASQAQEIFENGFELANPAIVSAGFALFDGSEAIAGNRVEPQDHPDRRGPGSDTRRPRNVSIYRHPGIIDIGFDLFWLIGPRERSVRGSGDRPRENLGRGSVGGTDRNRADRDLSGVADRSRGRNSAGDDDASVGQDAESETSGRGTERSDADDQRRGDSGNGNAEGGEAQGERERGGGRSILGLPRSDDSDDDDDDDDDDELIPYAVAAVAAAGILGVVGGTVGYYGSSRHAPIGLTSGYIGRDGGVLLQVAANEALLVDDAGPKRLMGRILGFGDLFGSPVVQPAVGAGALFTSDGGDVGYEPSASIGAVVRHNMLMFYGGFDVWQSSPEFSVAINFRALGLWSRKGD